MASKKVVELKVVVSAVAEAMGARDDSGGLVLDMCEALKSRYAGEAIPKDEGDYICDEVARIRQWTSKAVDVRKSEVRAIMTVYPKLPAAIEAVREVKNNRPVTFEAGLKLARSLKAGNTPKQAAAAYIAGGKGNATKPADRDLDASKKSASTHAKRILEHTALPIKFRNGLRELCEEHGIVI